MTNDPGKENLAEKQLSQLYQTLDAPEASSEIDEAILAFARQRTMTPDEAPNKPVINWKGGFSVAASILLVSVLYWAQLTPVNFSKTGSSNSKTPEIMAEQDVIIAQRQRSTVTDLKEQKTLVTAARVSPAASTMAADTLSVESPPEAVVAGASIEASAMIAEEHSRESQFAKEQSEEEQIDDNAAALPEAVFDTEPEIQVTATDRFSLENQLVDSPKIDSSRIGSTVLPDCNLSLHGGYKLVSTPLAKYTISWNDNDKVWLINMLNDELEFAKVLESRAGELSAENLSEENLAMLSKSGFGESYAAVVNQLHECRKSFGRAIQ